MEVTLLDRIQVFPSESPFEADHVLSLSTLDTDPNLNVIIRYLRAYRNSVDVENKRSPFEVISECLSKALVQYYPFAGTLRRRDGRLDLVCKSSKGVTLIRAGANQTLASLNYVDDPAAHFVEQLVYDPDIETGLGNPFVLQVTDFDCGGFTLGATIHHALCDGMGSTQFFNSMAEFARGLTRSTVEPVWDRAALLGPRSPPRVEFPLHDVLGLDKEFPPYCRVDGPVVRECFDVKDADLERFKDVLLEKSGVKFTTFEALGAYIWRARVKVFGVPGDEKVKFAYSLNIRKLVKPPLPIGYWGNGCVPVYVQLTANELVKNPIWETAKLIRNSKRNATDEYVRSFIDFQEMNFSKGITAGKGVNGFTDWRHLGHSTLDFGWGGPVTVLPLSNNILGSTEPCFFLPYSSANAEKKDGFKVLVCLPLHGLPAFREEMLKLRVTDENNLGLIRPTL